MLGYFSLMMLPNHDWRPIYTWQWHVPEPEPHVDGRVETADDDERDEEVEEIGHLSVARAGVAESRQVQVAKISAVGGEKHVV